MSHWYEREIEKARKWPGSFTAEVIIFLLILYSVWRTHA